MAETKTGPRGGRGPYTLELVGLQPGAERPPVLVQAVDAKGAVLHSERVGDAGAFTLPPDALKNARCVVIGASQDDKTIAQGASVRFRSPGDDTKEVPFAALTHLFCCDNRVPVADITRLVLDGTASNEQCQFLAAAADGEFAIEYRAYVPDERFQQDHSVGWVRGLNGTALNGGAGSLATPASPANVGKPPAAAQNSDPNTFATMLTSIEPNPTPPPATVMHVLPRCAFAVTLTTRAKTTDGASFYYPHAEETAAFALAINALGSN